MGIPTLSLNRRIAVLMVGLAVSLGACGGASEYSDMSVWRDDIQTPIKRDIRLDLKEAKHVLRVGAQGLDAPEAGRLGAFLSAQGSLWSMDVTLQPLSVEGAGALEETANIVARLGVQPTRIHADLAPATRAGDGDLLITVQHTVATPIGCPDFRRTNLMDLSELNSSNFGCATADNLARSIADPRDLAAGRTLGPANGAGSVGAVTRYRTDAVKPLVERAGGASSGGDK